MATFQALIDAVASPPWLFCLALALFLLSRGSKLPWTIGGGAVFTVLAAVFLGISLRDPSFRHLILHPERLPVVVLLLSTGAVLWHGMYRARGTDPSATTEVAVEAGGLTTTDAVGATVVGLILILCATFVEPPLGDLADPSSRPPLIKAPWFLVGLQELRFYFDPWWASWVLPSLYVVGLLGLPGLETKTHSADPRVRSLFLFGWIFLWLWPLAVGALLRGPHWMAFGPFEAWDATKPAPPPPLTLSARFWIQWLGILEPTQWLIRELPGLLLIAGYGFLLPRQMFRWQRTRELLTGYRDALGPWRFYAAVSWFLTVLIVPLKMVSRWWLGIDYWIHIPELGLRF